MFALYIQSNPAQASTVNCTTGTFTVVSNQVTGNTSCTGTVIIPSGVTSIAANAFNERTGITSVSLPESLITIGDNAFRKTSITSLTIPNNVLSIGSQAFYQTKIDTLDLGLSLQTISNEAFADMGPSQVNITIPNSVTTLGAGAFQQSRFGSVVIGTGLTTIPTAAFYNNFNAGVTSLTIGSNVTTIELAAFVGLRATEITIPNSVTTIGERVFEESRLVTVTLSDNLSSMHTSAFLNSRSLSRVYYCGNNSTIRTFSYPNSVVSACNSVPGAPTSLTASAANASAEITFTAGSEGGSAITNYKYSTDGTNFTPLSPTDASSPITITGLTNGTTYSIYLKAVNANGDSIASTPVSVTPVAPSGVSGSESNSTSKVVSVPIITTKVIEKKRTISWNLPQDLRLTIYNLTTKKSESTTLTGGSARLSNPKPGQSATYTISSATGEVLKTLTIKSKPGIPKKVEVQIRAATLNATWKKAAGAKKYRVTITPEVGKPIVLTTTDPNISIDLESSAKASIKVVAIGANGLASKAIRKSI